MTIRDLAVRLANDEVVTGEAARTLLRLTFNDPSIVAIAMALAHLDAGEVDDAKHVLEERLDAWEGDGG